MKKKTRWQIALSICLMLLVGFLFGQSSTKYYTGLNLVSEYKKECTAEWRLNRLIEKNVWTKPIRTDWKEVLYKEPTLEDFERWLKMRSKNPN